MIYSKRLITFLNSDADILLKVTANPPKKIKDRLPPTIPSNSSHFLFISEPPAFLNVSIQVF